MTEPELAKLSFEGAPQIKVVPPGPKSREILAYQGEHESSVVSYPKGIPMALKRGKGATLEDEDGNIYIDMFGGAGVMAVGYGHPEVLKAAHKQIDEVTHTLDIPTQTRRRMVAVLTKLLPKELNRVFFGGAFRGRDIEAVQKTTSGLTKLLFPDHEMPVPDEDLEAIVRMALEARRRVKEQQKRCFPSEFRNTHFSYTLGSEGVEQFVQPIEFVPMLHHDHPSVASFRSMQS